MRAELRHADGLADGQTEVRTEGRRGRRTEMTKLTVALRKFSKEPKNSRELIF
jgi:hypothetical protein